MITRFTRPPCQWCNFSVEMWNCVVTLQCKKHPIVRTSVYLCRHRAPYQGLLNLGQVTYCSTILFAKETFAIYWNKTKHVSCHCKMTRLFCLCNNEPEKPKEQHYLASLSQHMTMDSQFHIVFVMWNNKHIWKIKSNW
jgi:hypothetical protein